MSSKTVEEAAWAEYQQWNEQNRASGPNRDWIAWYQGYTAGAAHGAAEERACLIPKLCVNCRNEISNSRGTVLDEGRKD